MVLETQHSAPAEIKLFPQALLTFHKLSYKYAVLTKREMLIILLWYY